MWPRLARTPKPSHEAAESLRNSPTIWTTVRRKPLTGYVLDDTVIDAFAFSDRTVVATLFELTQRNIRVSVPAVTLAYAQASLSDDQCDEVNSMIDHLETFQLEPFVSTTEVTALARILGQINDETTRRTSRPHMRSRSPDESTGLAYRYNIAAAVGADCSWLGRAKK
ncbi:MAG TPA: hypothetical protein VIW24_07220 [Aldersonia sp.]